MSNASGLTKRLFEDAFNIMCHTKLGSGAYRDVFLCRIDNTKVVKVERDDSCWRKFHNVLEAQFWSDNQYNDAVAKWLAPIDYVSPDGFLLVQPRCEAVPEGYKLPDKLPAFLTDLKRENFGLLKGKLVCLDYALTIRNPVLRLRKVEWP
jgi:hypothetical protein